MMFGDIWIPAVGRTLLRTTLKGKTYRIVPSRFPTISIFESSLSNDELEDAYELESLTNPRLRFSALSDALDESDWVSGPGSTAIMAAFLHFGKPSRFTDGSFGVYYAGLDLNTAIVETAYWQSIQLLESEEGPMTRDMRVYISNLKHSVGDFVDVRGDEKAHHPTEYEYPRQLGRSLRDKQEYGVVYNSVRKPDGECVAVFRPPILGPAKQSEHLRYYWDGNAISRIEQIRLITTDI